MAKGFNKGPQMGGGQAGMMQQLQKMQQQMAEAQEKLAVATVTATAGGGAIKVVMTVEISPDFIKDADAEMLQDLVLSVVNMALDQSRALQEKLMGPLAGGLPF